MKRFVAAIVGLAAAIVGLVGTSPAANAASSCDLKIKVLPTLAGPNGFRTGVNGLSDDASIAVGESAGIAVYWKNGVLKKVPLPAGYTTGSVNAVNHFGLMVGTLSGPNKPARAYRYWSGQAAVQFYPQGATATDINNSGRAVGYDPSSETGYEYWQGTQVRRTLPVGPGTRILEVTGINDANRIIGRGLVDDPDSDADRESGLTWSSGVGAAATELQPVPPADSYTVISALGIDNSGRIVGQDNFTRIDYGNGVYWASAQAAEIIVPRLDGLNNAAFTAVTPSGFTVVGYAAASFIDYGPPDPRPLDRAVLWRGAGALTALPSLPSGGDARASAVGSANRVGGWAVDGTGVRRPVLWTCGSAT